MSLLDELMELGISKGKQTGDPHEKERIFA
jgi:hypothetical protein